MDSETGRNEPSPDSASAASEHGAQCVLEIEELSASLGRGIGLARASHTVPRGAFEMIDAEDQAQAAAFSNVCSGLVEPSSGVVRFLGHDWKSLPPDYANALRGRIGRTFADEAWLPHLSLLDNILLQQRHHTRRTEDELVAEASRLASAFGLPGVPVCRPEEASPADSVRAGLVRAFAGDPALILLEHPLRGRHLDLLEPLVNVIAAARRRGAAVLWLTLTPATWALRNLPLSARFRLSEGALTPVTR